MCCVERCECVFVLHTWDDVMLRPRGKESFFWCVSRGGCGLMSIKGGVDVLYKSFTVIVRVGKMNGGEMEEEMKDMRRMVVPLSDIVQAMVVLGFNAEDQGKFVETLKEVIHARYRSEGERFPFGRNAGSSIAEIFRLDRQYCEWFVTIPNLMEKNPATYHALKTLIRENPRFKGRKY